MIKKPAKKNPDIFSFMNPLSEDIWYFILVSYLAVSSMIFIVSRISPNECRVEEEKNSNGDVVTKIVNEFSFCNSLWFTLSAFMQVRIIRLHCSAKRKFFILILSLDFSKESIYVRVRTRLGLPELVGGSLR